jgi:predicted component of type VI protein secretion system
MRTLDDAFAAFKRDWLAGADPDVGAYADAVPPDQQDAFADLVDTWIALAPDVAPALGVTQARVAADPSLAALAAAYAAAPGSLAVLLAQLRATRRWSVGELAGAFAARVGLPGASTPKVSDYLERVERGEHEGTSVSRRALDALGELLGVGADALTRAALPAVAPQAEAAGGARFRGTAEAVTADAGEELRRLADALRTPAPAGWDEVDELFCAGR